MKTWYIAADGQQYAASSTEELLGWIREGRVPAEAMVWCEGMAEWAQVLSIAELASSLAPPPPPAPPAPPPVPAVSGPPPMPAQAAPKPPALATPAAFVAPAAPAAPKAVPPPIELPPIVAQAPAGAGAGKIIAIVLAVALVGGGASAGVYWFFFRGSGEASTEAAASSGEASSGNASGGARSGGAPSDRPMPVALGEEHEVTIDGTSRRDPNDGITHIQGLVIFVSNTKVGDRVKIKITKINRTSAVGEVIETLSSGSGTAAAPAASGGAGDKPVSVGQELDVTIESVGSRGDGVAKVDGYVVFVPGTKQGDRVRIRITRVGDRAGNGEVISRN